MTNNEASKLLEKASLSCYVSRIGMARREAMEAGSESEIWEEITGMRKSFLAAARKGRTEEQAALLLEALAQKLEAW